KLDWFLPPRAVLVFNQTKVVPARLPVIKPTGGRAELLYLNHNSRHIRALCNKPLASGSTVALAGGRAARNQYQFRVIEKSGGAYLLKPNFPTSRIRQVLQRYGRTPLPPYIKHSPLSERAKRLQYQSVFARAGLSVAAPTASLHFSRRLLQRLQKQGIGRCYVTLNVNLGTFSPLKPDNLKKGRLHTETYQISPAAAQALNRAKREGRPIIAVGTTVVRTLESACRKGELKNLTGSTSLFIKPGYRFKFIDGLITNFHVPKSSLLMLVAALVGRRRLLALYRKAIAERFRFFSFGDGMLLLP
ncbi:MAG TPA: tRNA preQ1(34) S-adenosylmethionine ribosyltransferase-isomerase QueA, partial [Patescibacteria group bacterium]|nr:tRNA preQ1(34) S-adenosylmethionine ribosyltransferase-isomerase QueA [Patescibacteria group bacterium]